MNNDLELPVRTLNETIRLVKECSHGVSINEPCKICQDFEMKAREMFAPAREV